MSNHSVVIIPCPAAVTFDNFNIIRMRLIHLFVEKFYVQHEVFTYDEYLRNSNDGVFEFYLDMREHTLEIELPPKVKNAFHVRANMIVVLNEATQDWLNGRLTSRGTLKSQFVRQSPNMYHAVHDEFPCLSPTKPKEIKSTTR